MRRGKSVRFGFIAVALSLGVWWSLASVTPGTSGESYPREDFVATVAWLNAHRTEPGVVIVDVRNDEYFDDRLIAGALRMPWGLFRINDTAVDLGGRFVGIDEAQKILGAHGITPNDTVVLYDSVERDGGATASYMFWVLDVLGHDKMKVLDGGIDAWVAAGGDVTSESSDREAMLYQAEPGGIDPRREVAGDFIYDRLGDPHYIIMDVRSEEEYVGEKPNVSLDGSVLKLGHIPTAVNIDYRLNWSDGEAKRLKSYPALRELYRGVDPAKGIVTYCHSGRRSSFTYFVLRVMGYEDVLLYERSWNEWGNDRWFFPVERRRNDLGSTLFSHGEDGSAPTTGEASMRSLGTESLEAPEGGYISCGG
jgi:thiosulfate/3-mercaptopyruvate sulfurtransferase